MEGMHRGRGRLQKGTACVRACVHRLGGRTGRVPCRSSLCHLAASTLLTSARCCFGLLYCCNFPVHSGQRAFLDLRGSLPADSQAVVEGSLFF